MVEFKCKSFVKKTKHGFEVLMGHNVCFFEIEVEYLFVFFRC